MERRQSFMSEENKALARRSWEAADNLDILDEVYAPDFVWHDPDQDIRGHEEARQFVTMYKTAFPDLSATVEDEIAEGDKVGRYAVLTRERQRSLAPPLAGR
jgi:ketosteroid isomerase-like protein